MIRPTRGHVLIEVEKAEEKTATGVYLAENAQEKPQKGTVIEVGKSNKVEDVPCQKGDKVYYRKWSGETIQDEGKKLIFVKFEDILGIYE